MEHTYLPCEQRHIIPRREEVPGPDLQACRHPPPNKILSESALPSPRYPTLRSSIRQGEGRASGWWDILSVCASEVILWDQDKELGPRLQAGPASREETPLIFFFLSTVALPGCVCFCRGDGWLHQT